MKLKTSELTGKALAWAVGHCQGFDTRNNMYVSYTVNGDPAERYLERKMNHPTTPCRTSMRPLFAWILTSTKAGFAERPTKALYICQTLAKFCAGRKLDIAAERAIDTVFEFIEKELENCTFGDWLTSRDADTKALRDSGNWREYNVKVNTARIEWLEWLSNPPT